MAITSDAADARRLAGFCTALLDTESTRVWVFDRYAWRTLAAPRATSPT
jgi:hypothetical protein